jgi:hypothetical protein
VTAYLIEYSADGKDDTWVKLADITDADDDGNVHTIYTDNHQLEAEEMRHYRVFAVNDRGMSDQFATAYATTAEATVPGMPTAIMTEVRSDTHIVVSWTAPAEEGTSAITGYDIEYTAAGGTAMMMEDCCTDLDGNLTMLMPDTEYTFRVRATNASGDGAWSDAVMATTMAAQAAELGMAANLRIGVNSGGTIQVTWDAADNAVGYIVIAIDRSDFSPKSAPVNPDSAGVTNTTLNLGGLTVGNNYYVYVAATGSAGDNTLSIPPLEVTAE